MKIVLCPNCYFDVKLEDYQYNSSNSYICIKDNITVICNNCNKNVSIQYDIDGKQYKVKFKVNDRAECYSPVRK